MKAITKVALYSMIISVVLSAAFGIFALFPQDNSWYSLQILLTTLTISGTSLCILACAGFMERKNTRTFPSIGITLAVSGAILTILGIWWTDSFMNSTYFRLTISVIIYAIAMAHLSLLSMAQLSKKYEWILWLAYFSVFGLAGTLEFLIVSTGNTSSGIWQFLGMISIMVGAVSVLVPILQKISIAEENTALSSKMTAVICPHCGNETIHSLGKITCQKCHSIYVVKILWVGNS